MTRQVSCGDLVEGLFLRRNGPSATHEFTLGLSVRVVHERRRALNGVCEPVKQSFSFLESKTCIG